ncbi:hypothetical protein [Oceanicoccus sagamiensis]|uniref:Phasin domain-containing protein n=1 Tax=Oceanicoccus sagamiensis TaxID=716816 RepID=A0A1X9NAD8_9GAMM|nr:hypothetical protein [Oceanicoccus sagamiensis]ARN72895.1 hypothetical protein BST96_01500 [Oceanicoccus sagamiensis]
MNNFEEITTAIQSLSDNQAKSVELQTAYYTDLAKQVTDSATELAEQTRNHLEEIAKATTFSGAFAANIKFEDSIKAKVSGFYQSNADATKTLVEEITKLYSAETAEAPAATKAPKAASKKAA